MYLHPSLLHCTAAGACCRADCLFGVLHRGTRVNAAVDSIQHSVAFDTIFKGHQVPCLFCRCKISDYYFFYQSDDLNARSVEMPGRLSTTVATALPPPPLNNHPQQQLHAQLAASCKKALLSAQQLKKGVMHTGQSFSVGFGLAYRCCWGRVPTQESACSAAAKNELGGK